MITGNIGEWSEFYAFIKILSDKVLYSADENLEKMEDNFYFVLRIIREEAEFGKKIYDISKDNDVIYIWDADGKQIDALNGADLKSSVGRIFESMKKNTETTFSIASGQKLMAKLHCTQIKASSNNKQDLIVQIIDPVAAIQPELGFSIKSMLGSPSTLLNASGATNFRYKIVGNQVAAEKINKIKGRSQLLDRVAAIEKAGGEIIFENVERVSFRKNMRMIDSIFPEMIGELIKAFFQGKGRKITDLVEYLDKSGILKKKFDLSREDFAYKIKTFLVSVALGMTPASEWDGIAKAHGGYIIVREDGDVVCYNLYNRDKFQEYLYRNTALDTPSTTRHGYGSIFEENGENHIKFNLQIRFIK